MSLNRYQAAVNALLLDFQWIEMSLRIVVGASYELLSKSAPPPIIFRPRHGVLMREALGRLIERYGEVSPNIDLHNKLRSLVKHRNHCAHQSFILSIQEVEDGQFMEAEILRMQGLKDQTRAIVHQLHEEMGKIAKVSNQSVASIVDRETFEPNERRSRDENDAT